MLNKLIAEYIKGHKRLVLPGFGAFIRKDTGEVVLVEFLKKDDGVLVSLIMEQQGVGQKEALETIEQYVAKIKRNVAQSGEYHIEGLGRIYVTGNGIYELEYHGAAMEEGGLPPAAAAAAPEKQAYDAPASATAQAGGNASALNITTPPAPHTPVEQPKTQPAPAQEPPNPPGQPVRPQTQPAARPSASYEPPRPKAQPAQAYRRSYAPPQKKKKSDMVMIIAVLAAVIALAAMGFSALVSGNPASQMVPANPPVEQTAGGNI